MTQIRERYHFIHNVFANFFKDTLNFFSECLYPRFEYTVVGTYDKAVEYIVKQCELGREADRPTLPALILNPTGDFCLLMQMLAGVNIGDIQTFLLQ
jgi:ketosteroid isomerase-like protein